MLNIIQVPLLKDNYAYILRNNSLDKTAIIDPSEDKNVLEVLEKRGWDLDYIINTHHHWDHTDGNIPLKNATHAKIIAYEGDNHRIEYVDIEVNDGDKIDILGSEAEIMFIPGHTLGHIAYYFPREKALFCGDTLFSLGCGRLFEGTPEQMFNSLKKLSQLPEDTKVYCGHEYTKANAKFALSLEPDNEDLQDFYEEICKLREQNISTIPSDIRTEKKLNPFLKAENIEEFTKIRKLKDEF